jgi:hypothetical protein
MAFPTTISAGQWSSAAIHTSGNITNPLALTLESEFKAGFAATNDYTEIPNIREFPRFGTPSNVVNVPQFSQSIASQVQGQSNPPDISFTLNYVPSIWAAGTELGDIVGDGLPYLMQVSLCTSEPDNLTTTPTGLGEVPNAVFYMVVKLEALEIAPSLTDATTATLTCTLPGGKVYGPFTVAAV